MKKFLLIGICVLLGGVIFLRENKSPQVQEIRKAVEKTTGGRQDPPAVSSVSGSIFVPYWTASKASQLSEIGFPEGVTSADRDYLIYFGIAPTTSGINTSEPGYAGISKFASIVGTEAQSLLTVRMIDEDNNRSILEDVDSQTAVINESLALTKQYGFSGIVLDLEHSVLPTQKVTNQITAFIRSFSTSAHAQDSIFALTLYGDTFYRARPYDVKAFVSEVDLIYIMTYDFHKSYGSPGPNFPLKRGETYGYSLEMLVDDLYEASVEPERLVFIFGMYGYDWSVDDENRPLKSATAVTVAQARSRFDIRKVRIDDVSAENKHSYTDDSGQKHVVWFENERSAQAKLEYLMSRGISKVGYWAWGYY